MKISVKDAHILNSLYKHYGIIKALTIQYSLSIFPVLPVHKHNNIITHKYTFT